MADYDFELAKKIVQKYSDLLEEAALGMAEDFGGTGETIYEEGMFLENINKGTIGGICGSGWATPILQLTFKDGSEKFLDCYKGCVAPERKPEWDLLGVVSAPLQKQIDAKRGKYLN